MVAKASTVKIIRFVDFMFVEGCHSLTANVKVFAAAGELFTSRRLQMLN